MNKNRVKLALHSAKDDISIICNKFLDAEVFNLVDLCYWWDSSEEWWVNKKYAEVVLKVLKEESCYIRVSVKGGSAYEKTSTFVELLNEMLRIEELLS